MDQEVVIRKVTEFFKRRSILLTCSVCHNSAWDVGPVTTSPAWSETGVMLGGPSVPVVALICNRCKHVVQFAWLPIDRGE